MEDGAHNQPNFSNFLGSAAFKRLSAAFDTWCALWFWPADRLDLAPLPSSFDEPRDEAVAVVRQLQAIHRFFHWELEFADVFTASTSGFDAIVGNPPWEIQKPNSKEYFSNIDPLYRSYGKQEAIRQQKTRFEQDAAVEEDWIDYIARYKALSNWNRSAACPFGDPNDGGETFSLEHGGAGTLHERWRNKRLGRTGYADTAHPFRHQGSADINTYKMFFEAGHALLKPGGRLGMIAPSGVYTDKGSTALRTLFLDQCRWDWLFSFENREQIFDIHRSFKFGPVVFSKGGSTERIRAAFMRHDIADWEHAEEHIVVYPRAQVERFSPSTKSILEVRNRRDLEVLEKIYTNSVLLGDQGPDGWKIKYAREFDMTTDSKLFPTRPVWEGEGYRPDEYGRWIKFRESQAVERHLSEVGWIRLADGSAVVHEEAIEDIALPLYQGVMIHAHNWSAKRWLSGTGLTARWEQTMVGSQSLGPQFLVGQGAYERSEKAVRGFKAVFRDIARSTDERTMISAVVPDMPCGNVLGVLGDKSQKAWALTAALNSFVFDWSARVRIGGTHLNWYLVEELPSPGRQWDKIYESIILSLTGTGLNFAPLGSC